MSATIIDGKLTVTGTEADDNVDISLNSDGNKYVVMINGLKQEFDIDDIDSVKVSLGAGDDTARIGDGVTVDNIEGNEGDDKFYVCGTVNSINGGKGMDILYIDSGSGRVDNKTSIETVDSSAPLKPLSSSQASAQVPKYAITVKPATTITGPGTYVVSISLSVDGGQSTTYKGKAVVAADGSYKLYIDNDNDNKTDDIGTIVVNIDKTGTPINYQVATAVPDREEYNEYTWVSTTLAIGDCVITIEERDPTPAELVELAIAATYGDKFKQQKLVSYFKEHPDALSQITTGTSIYADGTPCDKHDQAWILVGLMQAAKSNIPDAKITLLKVLNNCPSAITTITNDTNRLFVLDAITGLTDTKTVLQKCSIYLAPFNHTNSGKYFFNELNDCLANGEGLKDGYTMTAEELKEIYERILTYTQPAQQEVG